MSWTCQTSQCASFRVLEAPATKPWQVSCQEYSQQTPQRILRANKVDSWNLNWHRNSLQSICYHPVWPSLTKHFMALAWLRNLRNRSGQAWLSVWSRKTTLMKGTGTSVSFRVLQLFGDFLVICFESRWRSFTCFIYFQYAQPSPPPAANTSKVPPRKFCRVRAKKCKKTCFLHYLVDLHLDKCLGQVLFFVFFFTCKATRAQSK